MVAFEFTGERLKVPRLTPKMETSFQGAEFIGLFSCDPFVRPCELISHSAVSFSAGKFLTPTIPMGKVTFSEHCQDLCLRAKVCGQTDASLHILSIPVFQTQPLSCAHTLTHPMRARTQGACVFIIHAEKCPVRMSLSCKPDSAGCSLITTPAVHHPISPACTFSVFVHMHDLIWNQKSTEIIYFPDKKKLFTKKN